MMHKLLELGMNPLLYFVALKLNCDEENWFGKNHYQ